MFDACVSSIMVHLAEFRTFSGSFWQKTWFLKKSPQISKLFGRFLQKLDIPGRYLKKCYEITAGIPTVFCNHSDVEEGALKLGFLPRT